MRETDRTTRQRITASLREAAMTPTALARTHDVTASDAVGHVEHIARSLEPTDERLLVAPPTCEACGFDDFDDPVNRPSRCPECKCERVAEPAFRVD